MNVTAKDVPQVEISLSHVSKVMFCYLNCFRMLCTATITCNSLYYSCGKRTVKLVVDLLHKHPHLIGLRLGCNITILTNQRDEMLGILAYLLAGGTKIQCQ